MQIPMTSIELLTVAAEARWLEGWTAGPTEAERSGLPPGAAAPDLVLDDHTGDGQSRTSPPVRNGYSAPADKSKGRCPSGWLVLIQPNQ